MNGILWRRTMLALVVILLAGCSEKQPQDNGAASVDVPQYDAATFFGTTNYTMGSGGPFGANSQAIVFSHDGADLLITSDASGVYNAYAQPLAGGAPRALTESTGNATFGVSWFPADRRMIFTADGGGNELNHIFVRQEDGATRDLTPGEKVKAFFVGWTADGRGFWVATNARDSRSFDLYQYDATGYGARMIYRNEDGLGLSGISRDGRWVALNKPTSSADSNLYVVDLQAKEPVVRLITAHKGDISFSFFTFSPDSTALVYGTDGNGEFRQAWSQNLESGETALVARAAWDIQGVGFSPSGRYRLVAINEDGTSRLQVTDTAEDRELSFGGDSGDSIRNLFFERGEKRVAFLRYSATTPANVVTMPLGGTPVALTNALNPAIDKDVLVASKVVRFASYDGLEIPAILYRPKQASTDKPVAALIWVHGGPGGQSRTGYSATIQHLVNHGYAVLAANNRGSSGYGKTFFHMDDKRHGEADLGDIVEARKYMAGLDWVDGDRVGIIGGSYGGYMVGAALAFRPKVFNVGVDIFGVMNWVRTLKSVPPWWAAARNSLYAELGDPNKEEERLRRISPLFHAENIIRPMLVIQGANDPRVLKQESDEIVAKVRANGVPVEYIVFPDEGHGFRKRANRIAASDAYVRFLDQYLKGDAPAAAATGG